MIPSRHTHYRHSTSTSALVQSRTASGRTEPAAPHEGRSESEGRRVPAGRSGPPLAAAARSPTGRTAAVRVRGNQHLGTRALGVAREILGVFAAPTTGSVWPRSFRPDKVSNQQFAYV